MAKDGVHHLDFGVINVKGIASRSAGSQTTLSLVDNEGIILVDSDLDNELLKTRKCDYFVLGGCDS